MRRKPFARGANHFGKSRKSFCPRRKTFVPAAQVILRRVLAIARASRAHQEASSTSSRHKPFTFPRRSLRAPREPSLQFCPPVAAVRRQSAWRSWRTSGQSNRIVATYDGPCPALAAGTRLGKQRSWRTKSASCQEPFTSPGRATGVRSIRRALERHPIARHPARNPAVFPCMNPV